MCAPTAQHDQINNIQEFSFVEIDDALNVG